MGEQKVIFQTEITCIVAFFVAVKCLFWTHENVKHWWIILCTPHVQCQGWIKSKICKNTQILSITNSFFKQVLLFFLVRYQSSRLTIAASESSVDLSCAVRETHRLAAAATPPSCHRLAPKHKGSFTPAMSLLCTNGCVCDRRVVCSMRPQLPKLVLWSFPHVHVWTIAAAALILTPLQRGAAVHIFNAAGR